MITYDRKNAKGYTVVRQGMDPPSSRWSDIKCPFCQGVVRAYHWSICGGGKKCSCGAKHDGFGLTAQPIKGKRK